MRLLNRGLTIPEQSCLCIVVCKTLRFATYLVPSQWLRERSETGCTSLERTPSREGVRFVGNAASIYGLTMHTVPLVVMDLRHGRIDGYLMEIGSTQACQLCIHIGMN